MPDRTREKIEKLIKFLKTVTLRGGKDKSILKCNILNCVVYDNSELTENYETEALFNSWYENYEASINSIPANVAFESSDVLKNCILHLHGESTVREINALA